MEKTKNIEALELTTDILKNIELGELPLSKVITKALRLARLVGDTSAMKWLNLEFSGYSTNPLGVPPEEWTIGARSLRHFQEKDKNNTIQTYMRLESVGRIEAEIEGARNQLQVCVDPNISVTSSNPNQYVFSPAGNSFERNNLRSGIVKWTSVLERVKSSIYNYVLQQYYELKFGDISENVFERVRNRVNNLLSEVCPSAIKELVSAYENLSSENERDWSNAANSCRRLLKEVADVLYPPVTNGKGKSDHKLTEDAYKNRLIAFVENKSKSEKFNMVIGSNLSFIVDRLDAINEFQSKGVHKVIAKEDAERLVVYTYLVIGDILTLTSEQDLPKPEIQASTETSLSHSPSMSFSQSPSASPSPSPSKAAD